jgi:hypothetical protein
MRMKEINTFLDPAASPLRANTNVPIRSSIRSVSRAYSFSSESALKISSRTTCMLLTIGHCLAAELLGDDAFGVVSQC